MVCGSQKASGLAYENVLFQGEHGIGFVVYYALTITQLVRLIKSFRHFYFVNRQRLTETSFDPFVNSEQLPPIFLAKRFARGQKGGMKIFTTPSCWSEKINFVDDSNVFVGFEWSQSCCERFGYFFSDNIPTNLSEGETHTDDTEFPGWNFDPAFCKRPNPDAETNSQMDGGDWITFRLVNGEKEKFLTLYNCHNSYYSHGFEMSIGGKEAFSGSL